MNVAMVNSTELKLEDIQALIQGNAEALDAMWVIITTFIIFTMQTGFGLLESGMVSRKNEGNVMIKNMIDVVVGGSSFWFIGYGIAFGKNGNAMTGREKFLTSASINNDASIYAEYFLQLAFSTTATTIISGAIAERVNLSAYIIFALVHTGFVYPFPAHWMWGENGWLNELGAYDFAGSGVVHLSGGIAAFVACILIGPRRNRFGAEKDQYYMASPTNVVLGTFFLWWGWIGFNAGSTFKMSGGAWKVAIRSTVITMNGACAGGVSALLLSSILKVKRGYLLDIPQFSSGILGGLVGITGIASSCEPWEAMLIGFIGGGIANGSLLNRLKVDDPVGAIGVHWAAGCWGMISVGLFGRKDSAVGLLPENGIFHGGSGKVLAANIAAVSSISLWAAVLTGVIIIAMKYTIRFRMDEVTEIRGSDDIEHNIKDPLVIFGASQAMGKKVTKPINCINSVNENIDIESIRGQRNSATEYQNGVA